MNQELVTINNQEISIKEFNGKRVVTFKEIDLLHERPEGTASKNFRNNREHFVENEDYYEISKMELGEKFIDIFGFSKYAPNGIILTQSGYLKIVKSFNKGKEFSIPLIKYYFNNNNINFVVSNTFEYDFERLLKELLRDIYNIDTQYLVDNYRIDYYIPNLNLAIEYDEEYHRRQHNKDIKRQKYISNKINCDFIRIDKGKEMQGVNNILKYIIKNIVNAA